MINKWLTLSLCSISLTGCLHEYIPAPDDPRYKPALPAYNEAKPQQINGSIYGSRPRITLYSDSIAKNVGDLITVRLIESTAASKDVSANYKKENAISHTEPTLFSKSYNNSFFRFLPWAKKAVGADGENGNGANAVSTATEFKGTGDADQNNSLSGIITVSVTEILPNDNLHIKGEKWITLSNGSEFIRLSGIVRPQDIGANNEIISTKIADARISYSGKGDVQRATVPGWLAKFFNATFFPF